MSLVTLKYANTGTAVQVGSCTNASTSNDAAIAVSGIIEIQDVAGTGGFVAFGNASDMAKPTADAAGAIYIPPFGITRPILVPKNTSYVRGQNTFKINVRSLDYE